MNELYIQLRNRLTPRYGEGEARAIAFLVMEKAFGLGRNEIYADKGSTRQGQNEGNWKFSSSSAKDSHTLRDRELPPTNSEYKTFFEGDTARLEEIVGRLENGEPVQYVLGEADFYGHTWRVAPGVLIPRPETEELITLAGKSLRASRLSSAPRILDVGTGSGCIAVSLALDFPEAYTEAWDISETALRLATENARHLGANVRFYKQDILWPNVSRPAAFDLIVSNPPYVCEREKAEIEEHVLAHEPATALFVPDDDPLLFYRALANAASDGLLCSGGELWVEINCAFGTETADCFREAGLKNIVIHCDLFGKERFIGCRKP